MNLHRTVQLILALILGGLVLLAGQRIIAWHTGYEENLQRAKNEKATGAILDEGALNRNARREADVGAAESREIFQRTIERESANESDPANRDARVVSDSRLRAFRERREARERRARQRLEGPVGER